MSNGTDQSDLKQFIQFSGEISIANILAVFISFAYVAGYLIHLIYIRSFGIENLSFLKADFLEIGLVFMIFSCALVFSPLGVFILIRGIRKDSGISEKGIKRTTLVVLNFCFILLFFALFTTGVEWHLEIYGNTMQLLFVAYIWFTVVGLILTSGLERSWLSIKKYLAANKILEDILTSKRISFIDRLMTNIAGFFRWLLLIFSILFDIVLLTHIPWVIPAVQSMRFYIPLLALLTFIIHRVRLRYKKIEIRLQVDGFYP